MVTFTLRLPPLVAGMLISFLTTWVMTTRPLRLANAGSWPSVAQQQLELRCAPCHQKRHAR